MVIDHIGIVVSRLEKAIQQWTEIFGYRQMTEIVTNSRQKVRVVFLHTERSITIKLIEPIETTSPVFQFASKGGGLHHLCFRCADVVEETARLRSLGFRVLAPPQPGEAFDNHQIAFVYAHPVGLNLELIDTDTKARLLEARDS
jgi:methylmalonyl-CoA/ethylmalonyl-CoA epimerase